MSPAEGLRPRVVVVGGGVAGLACAYLVRKYCRERGANPQIHILEERAQTGGSTRTERAEGYVCEWGPNGFLDNEPATLELIEYLGLTGELVRSNEAASKRFIYHSGRMHEVPLTPKTFLRSGILPVHAKLRMAMEAAIPPRRDDADETVYDFARRRLGDTFAHYMIDPMVSGIFAGNAKELSLRAVFPKMVEMESEHGGLIRAMIAKKRASKNGKSSGGPAGSGATLTTLNRGMGQLTETLAEQLNGVVETKQQVVSLHSRGDFYEVVTSETSLACDAVILACPSYAASSIVNGICSDTSAALSEIPYAPVDVVAHGHPVEDVEHSLDGFGVLIPRGEEFRILGSLWCDAIFPGQAPAGMHLLRTILGGAHDPGIVELSDAQVEDVALREHRKLLGVKRLPEFRRVIRHEKGIAQYTKGHLKRVGTTEEFEKKFKGVYFTGASYRGVSVNGCVKDAFRVALDVLKQWKMN